MKKFKSNLALQIFIALVLALFVGLLMTPVVAKFYSGLFGVDPGAVPAFANNYIKPTISFNNLIKLSQPMKRLMRI